jgi:hypothetical protein
VQLWSGKREIEDKMEVKMEWWEEKKEESGFAKMKPVQVNEWDCSKLFHYARNVIVITWMMLLNIGLSSQLSHVHFNRETSIS